MRDRTVGRLSGVLTVLFLGSPSLAWEPTPAPPESSNVAPASYRAPIAAALKKAMREPDSVKDPKISKPFLHHMGVAKRYVVCARYNAKNAYGGYTGQTEIMAVFVAGKFSSLWADDAGACRAQQYTGFPELMTRR